mmetsp:Transcript_4319/g.12269  ORF Transcript_4319/g.12269 Transcript_4319/m.12269 type:complete len:216 (-) Transcript_4319:823-1470(-)
MRRAVPLLVLHSHVRLVLDEHAGHFYIPPSRDCEVKQGLATLAKMVGVCRRLKELLGAIKIPSIDSKQQVALALTLHLNLPVLCQRHRHLLHDRGDNLSIVLVLLVSLAIQEHSVSGGGTEALFSQSTPETTKDDPQSLLAHLGCVAQQSAAFPYLLLNLFTVRHADLVKICFLAHCYLDHREESLAKHPATLAGRNPVLLSHGRSPQSYRISSR